MTGLSQTPEVDMEVVMEEVMEVMVVVMVVVTAEDTEEDMAEDMVVVMEEVDTGTTVKSQLFPLVTELQSAMMRPLTVTARPARVTGPQWAAAPAGDHSA